MTKRAFALALLATACLGSPGAAQQVSDILRAEFLPGWKTENGTHMGAVHLRLAQGWKTYWRSPGDAGIPPEFDFSGSANIKGVKIHWPRPEVFDFNGMRTIGYTRDLVLPVEIWPQRADEAVEVSATMDLGVCSNICVPASVNMGTTMGGRIATDPAIVRALKARPQSAQEAGLRQHSCTVDAASGGLRLTARMTMPKVGPSEVVVVETADPRIWVSEATVRRDGGVLTAEVQMVSPSRQAFALDRSGVRLTVLAKGRAVEISGCPAP